MSRDVPYDPNDICDTCGKAGAYDFMGDLYCQACLGDDDPDDAPELTLEDFERADAVFRIGERVVTRDEWVAAAWVALGRSSVGEIGREP